MNYFIRTPIRLCNGERYLKRAGIASGSYFTQLIGSVINYIILCWYFIKTYGRPPKYIKVLGDDSFVADDVPLVISDLDALVETIGMKINIDKSIATEEIDLMKFLGFQINYGMPLKPTHFRFDYDELASILNLSVCPLADSALSNYGRVETIPVHVTPEIDQGSAGRAEGNEVSPDPGVEALSFKGQDLNSVSPDELFSLLDDSAGDLKVDIFLLMQQADQQYFDDEFDPRCLFSDDASQNSPLFSFKVRSKKITGIDIESIQRHNFSSSFSCELKDELTEEAFEVC
ncbi:unnamed protein product [Bemisia tabaci]|uniref:RNA-directed RNA polymerase C-terminal domain-containing protein n=1 Tax=Bemisia tabaci TaxID=7038 RepID=A0A9P0F3K4_BEMTA|nr:unnamed protein product [Bemisia tabaci]